MKPLIAALLALTLATAAHADYRTDHEGGAKHSDRGMGGDTGNDGGWEPPCDCGRLTPLGTDEFGNPSTDTPGLGPDWDPHRDDPSSEELSPPGWDYGWDD